MNKLNPVLLGLSLAFAGGSMLPAQDMTPETPSIPKVLQITREFIKPYKGGAAHDQTESAFVQAMAQAKWPTHYLGLNSLSGKSRGLYLTHYASFEAWEKDTMATRNNAALSAALESASVADGALLDEVDTQVYTYDPELSYHPHADISHARYMEFYVFQVKPGHGRDWREIAKIVKDAHEKAGTAAHWAMFEGAYGVPDGTYIAISSDKTLAEIDAGFLDDKKFREALGEEGMKRLDDLFAATVESSHTELFSINPRQSYVSDDWIQADPDFWKPKPTGEAMTSNP